MSSRPPFEPDAPSCRFDGADAVVAGASTRRRRAKNIYLVLAGCSVLAVLCGLSLNHCGLQQQEASLLSNQVWASRRADLHELSSLAGRANAPGNAVFETRDIATACREQAKAESAFISHLSGFRRALSELPNSDPSTIGEALDSIDPTFAAMSRQANRVFAALEAGDEAGAGTAMAAMDAAYFALTEAVRSIGSSLAAAQAQSFATQPGPARRWRPWMRPTSR